MEKEPCHHLVQNCLNSMFAVKQLLIHFLLVSYTEKRSIGKSSSTVSVSDVFLNNLSDSLRWDKVDDLGSHFWDVFVEFLIKKIRYLFYSVHMYLFFPSFGFAKVYFLCNSCKLSEISHCWNLFNVITFIIRELFYKETVTMVRVIEEVKCKNLDLWNELIRKIGYRRVKLFQGLAFRHLLRWMAYVCQCIGGRNWNV